MDILTLLNAPLNRFVIQISLVLFWSSCALQFLNGRQVYDGGYGSLEDGRYQLVAGRGRFATQSLTNKESDVSPTPVDLDLADVADEVHGEGDGMIHVSNFRSSLASASYLDPERNTFARHGSTRSTTLQWFTLYHRLHPSREADSGPFQPAV